MPCTADQFRAHPPPILELVGPELWPLLPSDLPELLALLTFWRLREHPQELLCHIGSPYAPDHTPAIQQIAA